MESINDFAYWVFTGVCGGCALYAVILLTKLHEAIKLLTEVVERQRWHEKEIDSLKERVTRVEERL